MNEHLLELLAINKQATRPRPSQTIDVSPAPAEAVCSHDMHDDNHTSRCGLLSSDRELVIKVLAHLAMMSRTTSAGSMLQWLSCCRRCWSVSAVLLCVRPASRRRCRGPLSLPGSLDACLQHTGRFQVL